MNKTPNSPDLRRWIEELESRFPSNPTLLIPALQHVHDTAGFLPEEAVRATARHLRVSESRVYGVASFYSQFRFQPGGANKITVCRGTACHVRGSGSVLRELERHLGVPSGGTTQDLQFTLETVACLGSCALAPVVVGNERVYGRQTGAKARAIVDSIKTAPRITESPDHDAGLHEDPILDSIADYRPVDLDHRIQEEKTAGRASGSKPWVQPDRSAYPQVESWLQTAAPPPHCSRLPAATAGGPDRAL